MPLTSPPPWQHADYARCLRRVEMAQNVHAEATYHPSTNASVTKATLAMLEHCKKELAESLQRLNESILNEK